MSSSAVHMGSLQGASFAGLAFTLWDILITFDEEYDFIWNNPSKLTVIKILYLFARYFPVVVQIVNSIIAGVLQARYPVPASTCRLWLAFQTAVTYAVLGMLDTILMIRVYALYGQSKKMGAFLASLVVGRFITAILSAIFSIPAQKFDESCLGQQNSTLSVYLFFIAEIGLQSTILILTFSKQLVAMRAGWSSAPLVSLLRRDGAMVYSIICAVTLAAVLHARLEHLNGTAHIVFPVLVSLLSSAGCRLIINMQQLVTRPNIFTDEIQLTTIIQTAWSDEIGLTPD